MGKYVAKYLKKNAKKRICSGNAVLPAVFQFAYWFLTILFLEAMLHGAAYSAFTGKFAYVAGFSASVAAGLALIGSFLPMTVQFIYTLLVSVALIILYGSQVIYELIFGTLYSVNQMQMGADAVTSFWRETISTMGENLGFILLFLIPVAVLVALRFLCRNVFGRSSMVCRAVLLVAALLSAVLTTGALDNGGTGFFTDYYFYHANDVTTTQTVERFGLLTGFRLELFGEGMDAQEFLSTVPDVQEPAEETTPAKNDDEPEREAEVTEATEVPVEYNVLDFDFAALNEKTDDETIRAVNDYVATLTGTNKNEYTGMLKDYNLVMICAESFASGAIHPELTPTLYRMVNEGFVFNNYYNAYPNNTTDGEYSFLIGLNPDGTRAKTASSFFASRGSYLPYTASMAFQEQLGIQPYGYHNHVGDYYARRLTHPNIGYTMKFNKKGLTFQTNWPSSDYEMMQQSVDDYLGQDQFLAYYMTFSGHYKYSVRDNGMSRRNWDLVKDLEGLNDTAKCYLAANIELDKALEYLLQRLEEEGVADRTAIVLAGDHFPYGLTDDEYSQLVGYPIDEFSKYKSSLIFWVGGMEEPVTVEEYCCNVDILPTILNLWGLEFDSRLLAGTDILSDGVHVAVRVDKSFYTDKMWLNANTGEIKYLVDESEVPAGYVDSMIRLIQNRLDMSSNILNSAYYNFLYDKGEVVVNRDSWN